MTKSVSSSPPPLSLFFFFRLLFLLLLFFFLERKHKGGEEEEKKKKKKGNTFILSMLDFPRPEEKDKLIKEIRERNRGTKEQRAKALELGRIFRCSTKKLLIRQATCFTNPTVSTKMQNRFFFLKKFFLVFDGWKERRRETNKNQNKIKKLHCFLSCRRMCPQDPLQNSRMLEEPPLQVPPGHLWNN